MQGDNPFLNILSKVSDLVFLNLLVLIGCLPIITAGAAITAGHFVALRIKRDESKVFSDFFRSFRENLGQATLLWLLMVTVIGSVLAALWFLGQNKIVVLIGIIILLLILVVSFWIFPLLSKFVNTTKNILQNGFVLSFCYLWRSLAMILCALLPFAAIYISLYFIPVMLLGGFSLPIYFQALLYNRVFANLEDEIKIRSINR